MIPAIKGCCIRLYDTGPAIHADATHINIGIASVEVDAATGALRVTHVTPDPVVTINPTPDETLIRREVTVGSSGGSHYTLLFFFHWQLGVLDLRNPDHYALISGPTSNLWYQVTHARECVPCHHRCCRES